MQQVYELNVRIWRSERSVQLGRPATLDDFDHDALDRLVEDGFTWLYLLGAWTTGPLAAAVSRQDQQMGSYLASVLTGFASDVDIGGSPFAVQDYRVPDDFGGDDALARLRSRAQVSGLSLMLDFVPNHLGLDHRWIHEQPGFCIQGDEAELRAYPDAFVRLGGRIFAHGRDPFFAPWKHTVQLDYSDERVQAAVIAQASSIAARCDGLRCDVAMLLLPDVFANTWRRTMRPFWRGCLDRVRAEHPGTLFMAEVYWGREYELQQAGFDFTYDKILYDRLLDGDAESIRAHLRASLEYQGHCVRFLENHEEQRAAARFSDPDHHRGALLITGMVPGMLLCHAGQEDGRHLHAALHATRRAPEPGSQPHREAYRELMHLLCEPARHDGTWRLLEPRSGHDSSLIACLWTLPLHHSLLVVVNASWRELSGAVEAGPLANRDCQFQDCTNGGTVVPVGAETLRNQGIQVRLGPWGAQIYRIMQAR